MKQPRYLVRPLHSHVLRLALELGEPVELGHAQGEISHSLLLGNLNGRERLLGLHVRKAGHLLSDGPLELRGTKS